MSTEPVAVRLLDKEYLVACTLEERPGLLAAASLLDNKMREVKNAARSAALDRVAVLAALNLAHELLNTQRNADSSLDALHHNVARLRGKLDAAFVTFLK